MHKEIGMENSAAYFEALMEFNLLPIIVYDFKGPILACNDLFLDMIGYEREEFENGDMDWGAMTPPEYAELDRNCAAELAESVVATPFVKEYVCADGERLAVRLFNAVAKPGDRTGVAVVLPLG